MNETLQHEKTDDAPVVSPLVNDKTYGERWYKGVFDWGLNYWANLLSSAGFSQYAEHSTREIKLPFMKEAATPRQLQQDLASTLRTKDPFMKSFVKKTNAEAAFKIANMKDPLHKSHLIGEAFDAAAFKIETEAAETIVNRSMARARSLTLLMPGFLIVIPTVWLGAKIKPWFVETLNRHHYGDAAMDDPTLKARHQAIEAEARPTFGGAFVARMGTFFAAQATAQLVGSKHNIVNRLGKNNATLANFGVDPFTEKLGETLGSTLPAELQGGFNKFTSKLGLEASEAQIEAHVKDVMKLPFRNHEGEKIAENYNAARTALAHVEPGATGKDAHKYKTATQDLGRFIVADTFYTMVTALTIRPILKALTYIPGMSYKPKMAKGSAQFNGETVYVPAKVKVPANQFGAYADRADMDAAPAPAASAPQADIPTLSINQAASQGTVQQHEQQIA